ncbi:MAG: ABC transporter permease [Methanoregula sp.]|jgi:ABC-2 type transport system permease protein|uniref:ABC transporter permease n=1 Tax=Methanoregula sp. TaxID=2052170 RepID=UPI003C13F1C8
MNPAGLPEQLRRAWAIAKKDIRLYYAKNSVLVFGILMPVFLFLAFFTGSRQLPLAFLIPGLVGTALLFTATAISPAIFSWEGRHGTLERLASCPVTTEAIVLGDMIASILYGIGITLITVFIGLALGLSLLHGIIMIVSILLAACCFSAIGMLLAVPPTSEPSTPMMLSLLIKFPLIFISGIFIPLEQMPGWGLVLAVFSPLTYFTDLVRYSFTETHYFPVLIDISALALFTLVFTAGTMYLHKRTMPKRL